MPSIRVLARELRISVITTKRAYDELEHEGLLHSVAGKGTFVAAANPQLLREEKCGSWRICCKRLWIRPKSMGFLWKS